jgi:2-phospho-L-lactate transferase/gluconeogenesis factor (CofD/UPF0052 family)
MWDGWKFADEHYKTLTEAKAAVDEHQKRERSFERQDVWVKPWGAGFTRATATSITGDGVWVSGKRRTLESSECVYACTDTNDATIAAIADIENKIAALEKQKSAKTAKLVTFADWLKARASE